MAIGDYKKARDYFRQSIINVELRMYPTALDFEAESAQGSKAQQAKANEMAKNQFLLAIRNF